MSKIRKEVMDRTGSSSNINGKSGLLLEKQSGQLEGFVEAEDPVMDINLSQLSSFTGLVPKSMTDWVADFQEKFTKLLETQKTQMTSNFEENTKQLTATVRSLRQEVERQKRTIISLEKQLSDAARIATEKVQVTVSAPPMPKIPASLLAAAAASSSSSSTITKSTTTLPNLSRVDLTRRPTTMTMTRPTTVTMIKTGIPGNLNKNSGPLAVITSNKIDNKKDGATTTSTTTPITTITSTPSVVFRPAIAPAVAPVVTPVITTVVTPVAATTPAVVVEEPKSVSNSTKIDKVPSYYLCKEDEINGETEVPSDEDDDEIVTLVDSDDEKEKGEIVIFDDEHEDNEKEEEDCEMGEEEEEEEDDFDEDLMGEEEEGEMEYYDEGSLDGYEDGLEGVSDDPSIDLGDPENPLTLRDIKVEKENQDCPVIVSVSSGIVKRSRKTVPGLRPGVDLGDVVFGVLPDPPPQPFVKIRRRVGHLGGRRPYSCDLCGKTFSDHWPLHIHKRIHTGERPHNCKWPKCTKKFTQLSHLQQHERIHKQERPFECNQCSDKFVQKCHLDQHKLIHSGVKPYHCDFCGTSFRQKSGLHGHIRRRHPFEKKIEKKNDDEAEIKE